MIPTRDIDELPVKKKNFINEDQNLVTVELVQVLHSKQTRIDELEQRLKDVEYSESQWKVRKDLISIFYVSFALFDNRFSYLKRKETKRSFFTIQC